MKTYNFGSAAETLESMLKNKVKMTAKDLEQTVHHALKYHDKLKGHRYMEDHEFNSRDINHLYHKILSDYYTTKRK